MSYLVTPDGKCLDADSDNPEVSAVCHGPIELTTSKSGETEAHRCALHAEAYYDRIDALEARLQRDYPGWDVPGSPPPAWFDPSYAGERWDEDD
jgi:hypothetical protein